MRASERGAVMRSVGPHDEPAPYVLDDQVGFVLRQVAQRHAAIFTAGMNGEVTPTQWAALAKLSELGPLSQNRLGRLTVMDAATIKGVIDRLCQRALTHRGTDPNDARRRLVALTFEGHALVRRLAPAALRITEATLAPLEAAERETFVRLLSKLK